MLGVTLCGLLLTPVFYNVLQGVSDWRRAKKRDSKEPRQAAEGHAHS